MRRVYDRLCLCCPKLIRKLPPPLPFALNRPGVRVPHCGEVCVVQQDRQVRGHVRNPQRGQIVVHASEDKVTAGRPQAPVASVTGNEVVVTPVTRVTPDKAISAGTWQPQAGVEAWPGGRTRGRRR